MNDREMKNKPFLNQTIFFLMLGAVILSACTGNSRREQQIEDSIHNRQIDSIVAVGVAKQADRTWVMIDSLEAANAVSSQRINYYRALAYNMRGDRKNAEQCLVKAMEGDALLRENRVLFYRAADFLSSSLINRHENKEALAVATQGFEAAKVDQTALGRRWVAMLLNGMGYCEMQLGRGDEAERCFSQAYITLKQLANSDATYDNLMNFARVSLNIMDAYTSTGQYEKAAEWVESTEEAVELFVASPECPASMHDAYLGGLFVQRAIVLVHNGRRAEADAAYDDALRLNYGKTEWGILECATYLKEAERWDDLQQLLPLVDSVYTAWGDVEAAQQWKEYDKKADPVM